MFLLKSSRNTQGVLRLLTVSGSGMHTFSLCSKQMPNLLHNLITIGST